jgi:hypothetical protein
MTAARRKSPDNAIRVLELAAKGLDPSQIVARTGLERGYVNRIISAHNTKAPGQ